MTAHHIHRHRSWCPTDHRTATGGPAGSGTAKEATVSHVQEPGSYEIRVQGHLATRWDAWFAGMSLTPQEDGSTLIRGPVADQAALHGLLRTLSQIGLPLLSVTPAPAAAGTDRG
jgi:hypothetical protein